MIANFYDFFKKSFAFFLPLFYNLRVRDPYMTKRNILITTALLTTITCGAMLSGGVAFAESKCGDAPTSIINCGGATGDAAILGIIKIVIQIMSAGIGILAVGAVIFGGILYSAAGGSPENIKKAKDLWVNTAIGLLIFAFFVAITNFLIPGGVF